MLRAYKFMIGDRERLLKTLPPTTGGSVVSIYASNRLAVAIANSQNEAVEIIQRVGAEEGSDTEWLTVADVIVLDLDTPKRLCAVGF